MCYLGATFRPRTPPPFDWQTRNLSITNQLWSLWLYTKYLMDMSSRFWIRRPLHFRKYLLFHSLWWLSTNNFTSRNATLFIFARPKRTKIPWRFAPMSLFSDFYLSLLFNFKIWPLLRLSCLMAPIIINIIIIIIIIIIAELEEKFP